MSEYRPLEHQTEEEALYDDAPSIQETEPPRPQLVDDDKQAFRMKEGAAGALIGVALAALLLFLGFWRTLFVAALACAGWFIGGVPDTQEWLKNLINRLFPPRQG